MGVPWLKSAMYNAGGVLAGMAAPRVLVLKMAHGVRGRS